MSKIEDYAAIGDGRAVALVSRRGSIDWLCWPRFDSPSIFGAILDPDAGHWSIAPAEDCRVERRYIPQTNILQTRFITTSGSLLVTDLMPVASDEQKRNVLVPQHELLRLVECEDGEVKVHASCKPRPRYGLEHPRFREAGKLGIRIQCKDGLLVLRSDAQLSIGSDASIKASFCLRKGEQRAFSLTYCDEWQAILPPLGQWSREVLDRSVQWWRNWLSQMHYRGPGRDHVERSALVLKLLVYAPSGAVVAAPTTSLPEREGGGLNWDYRYCWLRDASLTVRALFGLGFVAEARAFVSWLLHSTRLTQPRLDVLYGVHGQKPPKERTLDHLGGHGGSTPVRVGNAAVEQLQLDVYGEVVNATAYFVERGGALDRATRRMLTAFGEYVCHNWQQPDQGIWEPRSRPAHHTHSLALCWVALNRLIELQESGRVEARSNERFRENRAAIERWIRERGWNEELSSYVGQLDGKELDAALLVLPWYGLEEPSSERMKSTYQRIRERLGANDDLLYRYVGDESPGEGAFGICSFWAVEYLARGGGSFEDARDLFVHVCSYANDVGLFGEEINPRTGGALGNFPQAFTHVGLINAGLSLQTRMEKDAHQPPREQESELEESEKHS